MDKAVVLLSGGLDSTTCLALAQQKQLELYAISFDYGQKHNVELEAAKKIAKKFQVKEHCIIPIKLPDSSTTSLINQDLQVPEYSKTKSIPNTYVPARNTIFLSYALNLAESINAKSIWIGCSSVDYSGYPDCRPEFIKAFNNLINLSIKITIEAPLMYLSKAETIKLGHSLGVDYTKTISCYNATLEKSACGYCDSCILREQGFKALNN